MNQSEFAAITCNLLKAREKSRVQGTIRFDSRLQSAAIALACKVQQSQSRDFFRQSFENCSISAIYKTFFSLARTSFRPQKFNAPVHQGSYDWSMPVADRDWSMP